MILGNSSSTTYCLRTPSSLLLLLAKLTGSTGSFPLLVPTIRAENAPAASAWTEPAESAEGASAELVEGASAEHAEGVCADPVESMSTEPAEGVAMKNARAEPAKPAEMRPEPPEEEWAAMRGLISINLVRYRGLGNRELLPDLPLDL